MEINTENNKNQMSQLSYETPRLRKYGNMKLITNMSQGSGSNPRYNPRDANQEPEADFGTEFGNDRGETNRSGDYILNIEPDGSRD